MIGVDLCAIPQISDATALEFIAETGNDMSRWKSEKHFAAWLNLTPNTKKTGGKVISSKMSKKANAAGQTLRMAASGLGGSKSPLGDHHRKARGRMGGKAATVVSAHRLARIIYKMISQKTEYDNQKIQEEHEKIREIKIKKLEKQLAKLKKEPVAKC